MKEIICNLKMHHNLKEILDYKKNIINQDKYKLLLAAPSIYLTLLHDKKYDLLSEYVSGKNYKDNTGAISAESLKSIDVKGSIIAHKEDPSPFVEKISKAKELLSNKMKSYIIISETKNEYDYQYTIDKLLGQIRAILSPIPPKYYKNITFIYMPSWLNNKDDAIDIDYLKLVINKLKIETENDYGKPFKFIYGGNLDKTNASKYLDEDILDGILLEESIFDVNNLNEILKESKK